MSAALNSDTPEFRGGKGGARETFRATGLALCDEANDRMLVALTDKDREMRFIASLDAGLARCDRTCMNLFAELRGLVNRKVDLAVNVFNLIGATAPTARGAVEAQRRVESASPEDMLRAAFEVLDGYCAERGITPEQARARLSGAEVVDTNGNGGPHG